MAVAFCIILLGACVPKKNTALRFIKIRKLTEEELEQVTGGGAKQPSCPIYQYKNEYKECTEPYKGTCKQCPGCELNL